MAPATLLTRRTEVEGPRPTARAGSNRITRRAEHASATTACGILAPEFTNRIVRDDRSSATSHPPHAALRVRAPFCVMVRASSSRAVTPSHSVLRRYYTAGVFTAAVR